MQALLYAFVILTYVILTMVDAAFAESFTGEDANVNVVLGFEFLTFKDFFGPIKIPWINTDWITAFWGMVTWDFWFFAGVNQFARTIVAVPFSAAAGWGIKTVVLPILLQATSVLIQGVRSTIGIFRGGG